MNKNNPNSSYSETDSMGANLLFENDLKGEVGTLKILLFYHFFLQEPKNSSFNKDKHVCKVFCFL